MYFIYIGYCVWDPDNKVAGEMHDRLLRGVVDCA